VSSYHLPKNDTCQPAIRQQSTNENVPRHLVPLVTCCISCHVIRHVRMLTSSCATCHPSSGDTCHFKLVKPYAKKSKMHDTCHTLELPRVLYGHATYAVRSCHVSCTDCTDRYSQHQIFACLARRTDRDNFSIRTPFEKVNIPPESGRRDGRNGTIFVAFRAL
jgi:hypothetical protein